MTDFSLLRSKVDLADDDRKILVVEDMRLFSMALRLFPETETGLKAEPGPAHGAALEAARQVAAGVSR